MGRKIPGKKHKGVKDPYQQQVNRHAIVKDKINAAPADLEDDQPMPERLQNIIEWKKLAVGCEKKRSKRDRDLLVDSRTLDDKEEVLRGMTRPDKPTPAFIQRVGESDRRFLSRVDRVCEEVVRESELTNKFKIDLSTNAETEQEVEAPKKQRGNIEEIMNAGGKKKKKQKEGNEQDPKLTKKEKVKLLLTAKKQAKLDKVQEKQAEMNRFRDNVAFGDIVHAPPVLNIPLRNQAKKSLESKPGRRGLLLNDMLKVDHPTQVASKKKSSKGEKLDGNKKIKLKDLPAAAQRTQERNRISAVEAYRKLKSKGSQFEII